MTRGETAFGLCGFGRPRPPVAPEGTLADTSVLKTGVSYSFACVDSLLIQAIDLVAIRLSQALASPHGEKKKSPGDNHHRHANTNDWTGDANWSIKRGASVRWSGVIIKSISQPIGLDAAQLISHLVPVPETIVTIEPKWWGFDYLLVRDEIVIVDVIPSASSIVLFVERVERVMLDSCDR
jgi:hypothetical protein